LFFLPLWVVRERHTHQVEVKRVNLENDILTKISDGFKRNERPRSVEMPGQGGFNVEYTFDTELEDSVEDEFKAYKPDYAAFVAMDAETGRVLSLLSYSREHPEIGNLALKAKFPAASVFKVITAAAAVEMGSLSGASIIPFNGRKHTLYRKNIRDSRSNRWTNSISLKDAFAQSVNTVFAKVGLFHVGAVNLQDFAERFAFNRLTSRDLPVEMSMARIPASDDWALAQMASGFTEESTMSPLQGALLASAVVNDGKIMIPFAIEEINRWGGARSPEKPFLEARPELLTQATKEETSKQLRMMMMQTVTKGTSRKSFRKVRGLKNYIGKDEVIEIGGKTGSLTGGDNPRGKCDWFVGYLRSPSRRIAVSVLTVNEKNWRVKSSYIAGKFFQEFLKREEQLHSGKEYASLPVDVRRRAAVAKTR